MSNSSPSHSGLRSGLLVGLAALSLWSCGESEASADGVLRFTAIPDDNTTELMERFAPVAAYLSKELGVPVEYVATSDYSASIDAFKTGDVHMAWFGGLTGVQARAAVPGSEAIAQGKVDPHFKSYFIANKDLGLSKSDEFPMELRGKSFTFGSDKSTSGRLMPEYYIRSKTGEAPADFFGQPANFSGSHDKTAKLVEAGTFQSGALNYKTYDRMVETGELDPEICRIVWVTPDYADYNWTAHPELETLFGAGFTKKLQAALVGMKDGKLLAAVDRSEGLIPASNADFDSIAELAVDLGFLRE